MKVMKFGGTSVGTPQRMKEVTSLVTKSGHRAASTISNSIIIVMVIVLRISSLIYAEL